MFKRAVPRNVVVYMMSDFMRKHRNGSPLVITREVIHELSVVGNDWKTLIIRGAGIPNITGIGIYVSHSQNIANVRDYITSVLRGL